MFGSFPIGRVLGIQVRIHWLFPALIVFLIWRASQIPGVDPRAAALFTAVHLAVLFGVVFLHELGHSLVARRLGVRVIDITFWPLGGMARMTEIPQNPRAEAAIAVAGPAVNFALAAVGFGIERWAGYEFDRGGVAGVQLTELAARAFVWINLMLGVFNLIPAFPMDGGRILRAALGLKWDWITATERAVFVGRLFAVTMVVVGLLHPWTELRMLPLVGLFVWWSGARELWAVRARAARVAFGTETQEIAEIRPHPSPVDGPTIRGRDPDADADVSGARRPLVQFDAEQFFRARRMSDADLERLENYRGRLRNFRDEE